MQRRHFMKLTGMLATLPAIKGIAATSEKPAPSGKQLYEWRIYTLEEDADGLDGFFRDTLIPAYNRKNIKAGAFVPYKKEEKERRLLLFIYPNITTYHRVKRTIWDDTVFRKAAQPYFDKTAPNPAYFNFESFLCEAFDKVPSLLMPDKNRTLFELRTYHSWYKDEPTRNAVWDKFRAHPDWQRIKNLPEYAYTATRNTSLLLSPLPYSQI